MILHFSALERSGEDQKHLCLKLKETALDDKWDNDTRKW